MPAPISNVEGEGGIRARTYISSELIPRHAVPPVGVETTVGEVGYFCEKVENTFPDHVPSLEYHVNTGLCHDDEVRMTYHHVLHHEREHQITQDPREVLQAIMK